MSSMITPEPSSSIAGAEAGIAGAEAGRFASACPPRPEHPAARRQANTNDRMDSLCAIMDGIVHAAADDARVEKGCARNASVTGIRSVAVRRFLKKPLTGPLQTRLLNIHGSFSPP
jgi:hypothetical protein